ncbi:hypothetical protein [Cohnella zeiphila]|uniref:hypothetical protein n=1 Tax=Cohnella zeiphila TaxID=2761120 RepID=UPI0016253ADC|nr:hypothetical protein [Cohnella zeiphila]
MARRRKKSIWAVLTAAALLLSACGREDGGEGMPSASGFAASPGSTESAAPAASETAPAADSFELKADRTEPPPEGAKLEPMGEDNPLYIAPGRLDASIRIGFRLDKRGDFLIAEGSGTLTVGKRDIPFTLDQTSVMRTASLSGDRELVFGALQADTKTEPASFAFRMRFVPETKELELRLSNGKELIVFGSSDTLAANEEKVEEAEAAYRPVPGASPASS